MLQAREVQLTLLSSFFLNKHKNKTKRVSCGLMCVKCGGIVISACKFEDSDDKQVLPKVFHCEITGSQ